MPLKKAALTKLETKKALKERADIEREVTAKKEFVKKAAEKEKLELKKQRDAERELAMTLSQRCVELAGEGCFFYALESPLGSEVSRDLRARGFRVSSVADSLKAIEHGLLSHWSLPTRSPLGLISVVEPLRKCLAAHILETLRDVRANKNAADDLAEKVFFRYCQTAGADGVWHLRYRLNRLLKMDKDELYAELTVRDFVADKDEFIQVRQQLGVEIFNSIFSTERREELFGIVRSALLNLDREENYAESARELVEFSDSLGQKLRGQLMAAEGCESVISWWAAYAAPPHGKRNYATSLFWLASPAGQAYFQELSQVVDFNAKLGRSSFLIEMERGSEEWYMSWIISMSLGLSGYRVKRKGRFNEPIQLVVSW